ncbi:MAG: homocysteine S-methyltransferase family protein [Bacteroidetes bacterium]|nr:homocysteine S-methyltransferase family protein [Bacteroidota bacterium]MCW5894146.1 homocysteine S-methyltransferase family protein [Bacteroidota bacterium]
MASKYGYALPQLGGELFLTDGGIESTLIFHEGAELPYFSAFDLLSYSRGTDLLRKYFRTYAEVAARYGTGLILESATWRANPDWARKIGYSREELADANRKSIFLLEEIRDEFDAALEHLVISGCLGPRGDGYVPTAVMNEKEAEEYHSEQVFTFVETAADMVSAITMNYTAEAIGIARAAQRAELPVAISFTVETDGNLPTGQALRDAIREVEAATGCYPAYYMINCAHPTHFDHILTNDPVFDRIRGLRANASRKSHAELNDSTELDAGNPLELGMQYAELTRRLKNLNILGGCCGTDHRHIEQIAEARVPLFETVVINNHN